MSRMTAHLAVADALRGPASTTRDGLFARAIHANLVGLQREALPTDTHFAQSWHLTGPWGIGVAAAWEDWTGAGIRVAVFDDGIDNTHPDLAANYDVAHQYNAETGATQGWPIGPADNHGTAVAGIIAAERNGVGVVGVSYGATLVSIFTALPRELIAALAGLALFGAIAGALAGSMAVPEDREAALITFLVTASGMTLFSVGSAFWGIVAGLLTLAILKGGRRR